MQSNKEPKLLNTCRKVKVLFILNTQVNHNHCKVALHCYTYLKERRCEKRNNQSKKWDRNIAVAQHAVFECHMPCVSSWCLSSRCVLVSGVKYVR